MDYKRTILRLARMIDLDNVIVSAYDKWTDFYIDVDTRVSNSNLPDDTEGEIFFAAIEGGMRTHMAWYCLLAHAFRTRGYQSRFLLCDELLELCHAKETFDDCTSCSICTTRGGNWVNKFNISPMFASEILDDGYSPPSGSEINPNNYKGIDIEEYVNASFRRFMRRYSIDLNNPNHRQIYERLLSSGATCVELSEQIFENNSIAATVTAHPSYIYGGIFMEVANKYGIPAYAVSQGSRKQHIQFGNIKNRLPLTNFSDQGLVSQRLKKPLSTEEHQWVHSFFEGLQSGQVRSKDYSVFGRGGLEESTELVIGLFLNLAWDAKMDSRNFLFDDPFEWIEFTIQFVKKKTDKKLVIKTHPAEALTNTNESFYTWILERFELNKNSLDNIAVLPPDTEVDQYEMIRDIDAGIVIDSTIGLEMTYIGTPAIVVGNAHYCGHGFTYDPQNKQEYKKYLNEIEYLEVTDEMIELCERYAYLTYYERHIPFKYHNISSGSTEFAEIDHQTIQSDRFLDLVVEQITSGEPVSLMDFEN